MKISTMRNLDYYLGIPLSFACRMMQKLYRLIRPKARTIPSPVRSVLMIELSEMGSMIQLTPLIAKTKAKYPDATIRFITFSSSAPILKVLGNIEPQNIWTLNTKSLPLFILDSLKLTCKLLFTRFDIVFDLELFSRISSLIAFCSGAHVKVGFSNFEAEGLYRGNFLTHPVNYNPHLTISQNFMSMLYALDESWDEIPHCKRPIPQGEVQLPPFSLPAGVVDAFRERLMSGFPDLKRYTKLVIFNPNSSEALPLRRWPMENYLALAGKLLTDPAVAILITGSPSEKADAAYLREHLPGKPLFDLSGFTSMQELIALYFIADLQVTNDSGPAQFAALAKLNTITFFGPETPDLYGALNPNGFNFFKRLHCSPCYSAYNNRTSTCTNNVCMQMITVEEVHAKALEMLNK